MAALKELNAEFTMDETGEQAYKEWKKEATALKEIGLVRNPHIIEVSAILSKGPKHYFLFPWADGGNLVDLWKRYPSPRLSVNLIRGIVKQLAGLADALKILHDHNWRHGDLKPENILIFGPGKQQCVWKMADCE